MGPKRMLLVFVSTAALAACQTSEPTGSVAHQDSCAWIAGKWTFSGCGDDVCTFFQDHCKVHDECESPTHSTFGTGTIIGNTFTFGGGYCTAEINGKVMTGSCSAPGQCSFTANHP
jgi:hypothetical protein